MKQITNPISEELIKQWHTTKNKITPFDISAYSQKKVWWKCSVADDHEWESLVANRSNGTGCPFCTGQKVTRSNCLAITHSGIAKQWHPDKNGNLTPFDIVAGSKETIWWKCPIADDHEWKTSSSNRIRSKRDCPFCINKRVSISNCLLTTSPELAKQWHPTKNGDLTPKDIVLQSGKLVWWKCPVSDDHEWNASPNARFISGGCPCCRGMRAVKSNCLATINVELAKEWHTDKNGNLTPFDVVPYSRKKVWWRCSVINSHEWKCAVGNRTSNNTGCPFCSGNKVCIENCLATIKPDLIKEWHSIKNGNLTPYDITSSSNTEIWWKCSKNHEWKVSPSSRGKGNKRSGCPICNESKGEKKVAEILLKIGCKFTRQAKFETCKNKFLLPFDFLVKKFDDVDFLIEYNGEQHYRPIKRSKNMSQADMDNKFKIIKKRDKIKKEWAESNNFPLLIIPYWDFGNIPELINEFNNSILKVKVNEMVF